MRCHPQSWLLFVSRASPTIEKSHGKEKLSEHAEIAAFFSLCAFSDGFGSRREVSPYQAYLILCLNSSVGPNMVTFVILSSSRVRFMVSPAARDKKTGGTVVMGPPSFNAL